MQFEILTECFGATGRHIVPLPVREAGPGAGPGRAVCLYDWAFLVEAIAQRTTYAASRNKVYPHCVNNQLQPHAVFASGAISSLIQSYLDPDWTPADGYGADGSWDWVAPFAKSAHALARTSPTVSSSSKTLRTLDSLRRMFYDVKRMTRLLVPCAVEYSPGQPHVEASGRGNWSGADAAYARPAAAAELESMIPQPVRSAAGFGATPAFCVIDIWGQRRRAGTQNVNFCRHLVRMFRQDGTVSLNGWNSSDLISFMGEKFPNREDGYTYSCSSRISSVYYDIVYPIDSQLNPWNWTPQS